jgi:hypothetical protein
MSNRRNHVTNLIKAGLALSFLVAIVVVECAAKKQPKPEPDPAFTVVENISVLPIVDARSGQKAEVNLEKLQEGIVRRLQKKRYTAAAANTTGDTKEIAIEDVEAADPSYVKKLGPTGERWVMVVFLDDVNSKMAHSKINFGSAGNAELSGYLFDKESGQLIWKNKGAGQSEENGLFGMADKWERKGEALGAAITSLLNSVPEHPKPGK